MWMFDCMWEEGVNFGEDSPAERLKASEQMCPN